MTDARRPGGIRHTWLVEPGVWEASGLFWSEGAKRPVRGHSIIRHGQDLWEIEAGMEIRGDPPHRIENRYEVTPPATQADVLCWHSRNPAIGVLHGTFSIMERTVLSVYRSEGGDYYGTESLTWLSPDRYMAAGLFCSNGQVLSQWEVDLTRQC